MERKRLITRSRKSPCTKISPSFTLPPTPHFDFNVRPRSAKSALVPTKPETRVAVFPPRPFFFDAHAQHLRSGSEGFGLFCLVRLIIEIGRRAIHHAEAVFPIVHHKRKNTCCVCIGSLLRGLRTGDAGGVGSTIAPQGRKRARHAVQLPVATFRLARDAQDAIDFGIKLLTVIEMLEVSQLVQMT